MQRGTIKNISDKGFGFIKRNGESKDLFFHSSELKNCRFNELRVGDVLEFDVSTGEKGPFATNISVVDNASEEESA